MAMTQTILPELLSPAGGIESAMAAINAGADALYLGGKNFNARGFAQNFSDDEIVSLIEFAAVRNVKIYITVNTLYKNDEMPQVLEFVSRMRKEGASAFILQDPGLAYILKSRFPSIEIHASTQMSVHSTEGVNFMESMGFSRVVLARELSLEEVAEINRDTKIGCEVFVHGALCVSYSGQCLMSGLIGGRSGNRGKCAQICRTKFDFLVNGKVKKSGYLLSMRDIMTLEILEEMTAAGVAALKIEGRMKSPEYVHLVTKAYREQLDKIAERQDTTVSEQTKNNLLQIFNRGGYFSLGYYKNFTKSYLMSIQTPKSSGVFVGRVVGGQFDSFAIRFTKDLFPGDGIEIWTSTEPHIGMGIDIKINAGDIYLYTPTDNITFGDSVYRSYDKKLASATKKEMAKAKRLRTVTGGVNAVVGKNLRLCLSAGDIHIEKTGKIVEAAQNAPMTAEDIVTQLSKTGDTPFEINFTQVNIDANIFVSKAVLNKLRREALEELGDAIIKSIKNDEPLINLPLQTEANKSAEQKLTAQISDAKHLRTVLEQKISRVYINYSPENIEALPVNKHAAEIFIALPTISHNKTEEELKIVFNNLENSNIDGYLVSTYGQLQILQTMNTTKQIMLNYTFNIFNSWAAEFFINKNYEITLSQELNLREINSFNTRDFELVVYGRQILMTLRNCPVKEYDYCKLKYINNVGRENNETYVLRDKIGANFPVVTDCRNCVAHILNSKILDTSLKFGAIKNTGAKSFRLIFTSEEEADIRETITRYKNVLAGQGSIFKKTDNTYGHFFRGVD
jgi:putative protease